MARCVWVCAVACSSVLTAAAAERTRAGSGSTVAEQQRGNNGEDDLFCAKRRPRKNPLNQKGGLRTAGAGGRSELLPEQFTRAKRRSLEPRSVAATQQALRSSSERSTRIAACGLSGAYAARSIWHSAHNKPPVADICKAMPRLRRSSRSEHARSNSFPRHAGGPPPRRWAGRRQPYRLTLPHHRRSQHCGTAGQLRVPIPL